MERNAWREKPSSILGKQTEGADVTHWGRLFQMRVAATGKADDDGQPRTTDSQQWWGGGARLSPGLGIGRALELIGEVGWCRLVQTLVHENSELELDLLWGCQPMQLPNERLMLSVGQQEWLAAYKHFAPKLLSHGKLILLGGYIMLYLMATPPACQHNWGSSWLS